MSYLGRKQLQTTLFGEDWYEELFKISLEEIAFPEQINFQQLRFLCQQQNTPVKYFPITLRALDFSTNNIWLDEINRLYSSVDLTMLPWTIDNVKYLTRKYRQAARIVSIIDQFVEWLQSDLLNHFKLILDLWQQCIINPPTGQH